MDTVGEATPEFKGCLTDDGWELLLEASGWKKTRGWRNLGYLSQLLESAAQNPRQPAGTLSLMTEAAALEMYRELNQTTTALPNGTVLDLISEKALAFGEENAVRFEDAVLSYGQLEEESTRLAVVLQARGADQGSSGCSVHATFGECARRTAGDAEGRKPILFRLIHRIRDSACLTCWKNANYSGRDRVAGNT